MAKKRNSTKSHRASSDHKAEQGTPNNQDPVSWMEERIDARALDADALHEMPLRDVKAQLRKLAGSSSSFYEDLNDRLPEGVDIPAPAKKTKKRTQQPAKTRTDRSPAPSQPGKSPARRSFFGLRGALITSAFVIAAAIVIPLLIQRLQSGEIEQSIDKTVIPAPIEELEPPTWIEGPDSSSLLRGIRYKLFGVPEEQVLLESPLPSNSDTLEATINLRFQLNGLGAVVNIEALDMNPHPLEQVFVDSISRWQFSRHADVNNMEQVEVSIELFKE